MSISITINDLTKQYQNEKGIIKVNTSFESGKVNIVIGDNGSGKSTLFKCIMGLVNYSGKIDKRKHRIGYAPEDYVMPLRMTVNDFLYSIGRIKGLDKDNINESVREYLEFFGLIDYRFKIIGSLSNGMRQKLNLLQAFVHEPKIIILDEPLAALDSEIIPKVVDLIKSKAKTSLVVISTHQISKFNFRNKKMYHFIKGKLVDVRDNQA
jgi:ABC-2 type transport system ATP-binding protein